MSRFILEGKLPVPCKDILTWARWFDTADRRVAHSDLGGTIVSTVFLGLDHGFGYAPPLLFETMVFQGPKGCIFDELQLRYQSWEEAEDGHAKVVDIIAAHTHAN